MTVCKHHAWTTRSRHRRYVVVVCTVCGEVRGAMPAHLSAELATALEPAHEAVPDPHVALP